MDRIILIGCLLVCLVTVSSAVAGASTSEGIDFGLSNLEARQINEMGLEPAHPGWAPQPLMWGHGELLPLLGKLLRTGHPVERQRAAFLLGQIGDPAACEPLVTATGADSRKLRIQAGIALTCLGDRHGQAATEAALIGEPTWIRYYAVLGLSRLNSASARRKLEQLQPGQPDFINYVITAALREPAPRLPATADKQPLSVASDEVSLLWDAVVRAYRAESDWWWHWGGHHSYHQCIRCMEVMLLMDQTLVETYSNIAWLQWSMGYNTEAIGTYHRAIQRLPDNPLSHYYLGWHYFNIGKYKLALPYLQQALKLGAKRKARHIYAHALERVGRIEDSYKQWQQMYEMTPQAPAVKLNYERLGRRLNNE